MGISKLGQKELHEVFIAALGNSVISHGDLAEKPLEVDLAAPLPSRIRLYLYNATKPPGGRTLGEHKIQLIVPGQGRKQRGNFNHSDGRMVLLVGYSPESEVFILWDAGVYTDFAYSSNLQVRPETVYAALAGEVGKQERRIRGEGGKGVEIETVITVRPDRLAEAIQQRIELTLKRVMGR
jgi:hypothetical protein